ncbi:MAG: glucosidase [Deltaproteobacteria bacterium]|nr:glucosidase [Deltaproteobacteria bacterium]
MDHDPDAPHGATPRTLAEDLTPEDQRLAEDHTLGGRWTRWGPYLSERQWGTVREDYSPDGCAWEYFPHDHARSRVYRWGEDGLAGFSDERQRLCHALALWNGQDPILKERLFGLTNQEGNHGEDCKELYFYLDSTPTHSYTKMLYKYPQRAFPYEDLVRGSAARGKLDPEYELLDTGVFDDDRYWDVEVEYAKALPDDLLFKVTVHNRGPEAATILVLPQLWFRNTWSWRPGYEKPTMVRVDGHVLAEHLQLGAFHYYCQDAQEALLTDNETNLRRLYGVDGQRHTRDAFHRYLVQGDAEGLRAEGAGTRAMYVRRLLVPAGGSAAVRARLLTSDPRDPFRTFDELLEKRRHEADLFYERVQAGVPDPEHRRVQRQAFAGMLWSKQYYGYNVEKWLSGDPLQPPPPAERKRGRNSEWETANNGDVLSMPDKWEYPWYAAWDLAFHTLPLAMVDPDFAKNQLLLLTREWYMHPNGQLPAYEWNFGDVNPPVHAWATWRVFQMDRKRRRDEGDLLFLERVFHKLLLNFTWWVNRKDVLGRNLFQGGFLGLDNIGVFDRSAPLPTGGFIHQSDGTSWMAMYCLNLLRIALELSRHNRSYEDIAVKFFEHFLSIAHAMTDVAGQGMGLWDDEDRFYYDVLHTGDGRIVPMKVRSMVGLIPLFAVETIEPETLGALPEFSQRLQWVLDKKPALASLVSRWAEPGRGDRRLLSLLRGSRMKALLRRMLDPNEFLSDHGVRALSLHHRDSPYIFEGAAGESWTVSYQPGESTSGLFGGNSNWRGPVWFPVNYLLIESLQKFHHYYGDDFKVECPTGSGRQCTLLQVADELSRRLLALFVPDRSGRRPSHGPHPKWEDPHFRDHLQFYEYFHGDSGHGLGASHQTGWTGLVARMATRRAR